MRYKKILFLCGLCLIGGMTGCSADVPEYVTTEAQNYQFEGSVLYYERTEDLADHEIYISHGGKYYALLQDLDATFDTTSIEHARDDRLIWFSEEDWEKIPTMYEGDSLVYRSSTPFSETFNIERYEYMGYTIGVSGMTRSESGRYRFDATEEDKYRFRKNSDAIRLTDLNSKDVVLDNIGGAQLRSGNITRCGTVEGLKANALYAADVYVGTQMTSYTLKADSILLCSMETTSTNTYTLQRGTLATLSLPKGMQTGYYNIAGKGLIRYVNGKSYTASTNFNVPNIIVATAETNETEKKLQSDTHGKEQVDITINQDGTTTLRVQISALASGTPYDVADPVVKLISSTQTYTLQKMAENEYSITTDIPAGRYTLELVNLYGRTYNYEVVQDK